MYRFNARGAAVPYLLGFVFVLFVGILIACYAISRQTNIVMLDEKGNIREESAPQLRQQQPRPVEQRQTPQHQHP
jgi:hypothetical protein